MAKRILKKRRRGSIFECLPVAFLLGLPIAIAGQTVPSASAPLSPSLLSGFESPPQSARPRVWWHWQNGNVTESGIKKDLQWMHRVGIGGVDLIDAALFTPQVVKTRLRYMSPGWKDAFRYAAHLAGHYGMEFGIDSSPGWSETGGPWVKPFQAMKKFVWSSTVVTGGRPFHGVLPQQPAATGPIQNSPLISGPLTPPQIARLKFYRDSVVIAYKAPVFDPRPASANSSSGPVNARALSQLSDGSLTDGATVTEANGGAWLELRYARLVRIQGVTLAASASGGSSFAATVYGSADGTTWKDLTRLSFTQPLLGSVFPQITTSFAPVRVRYARVVLAVSPPQDLAASLGTGAAPGAVSSSLLTGAPVDRKARARFHVHELVLHSRATVNQFEAKADFRIVPDYYAVASSAPCAPGTTVNPKDAVDLTNRMKPGGTLDWTPPPGRWVVLRIGYSLEGTTNHPVSQATTGLEVDKLSRRYVKSYMEHYLDTYQAITGPFGPGSVNALTNDSIEVGMQNWTDDILQDFRRLRGYDPLPWLPALTGVVVGTAAQSDRFLWDFRRTVNELLAKDHYGEIARIARARGLRSYAESLEGHRVGIGDDIEMRQYASVPMGAMWTYGGRDKPAAAYVADLRGAASVAHVFGRKRVAAESMGSADWPWAYAPRELKPVVDMEFALGVNRIFVHESAHQPNDKPPGLSLYVFGQMFDRLDTWAAEAGPWVRYMARCSYLLQQGRYVADIAYFYGQEASPAGLFSDKSIDVPHGYGFDFIDPDALLHALSIDRGRIVTRSGMRYRILYLGGTSGMMTLDVLRRIEQLVREGATVVGRRPVASPSLRDDPSQFRAIAAELFGSAGSTAERHVGAGSVFPSGSLPEALSALHLQPDFTYSIPQRDAAIHFTHRRLRDGDIYFITNQLNRPENLTASFRITGFAPQLWSAVTGAVDPVSFKIANGRTSVPLDLPPYGSVFVVFRKPAAGSAASVPSPKPKTLLTLHGPWRVSFQANRGAPGGIEVRHLASWSGSTLPGVRYFAGTGTYTKRFRAPGRLAGTRVLLDLGQLWELAQVRVNGKPAGIVWTPPFRLDITKYVHPGENTLSIGVTNLWVNRLIGDQQPGVKEKYTFTTIPTYGPDAPLRLSGLLGPVRIEQVAVPANRTRGIGS